MTFEGLPNVETKPVMARWKDIDIYFLEQLVFPKIMPISISNIGLSGKTQKIGLADMWAECRKSERFLHLWGTKTTSNALKFFE